MEPSNPFFLIHGTGGRFSWSFSGDFPGFLDIDALRRFGFGGEMKSMDELKLLIALMVVDYVTQSTSPTLGGIRVSCQSMNICSKLEESNVDNVSVGSLVQLEEHLENALSVTRARKEKLLEEENHVLASQMEKSNLVRAEAENMEVSPGQISDINLPTELMLKLVENLKEKAKLLEEENHVLASQMEKSNLVRAEADNMEVSPGQISDINLLRITSSLLVYPSVRRIRLTLQRRLGDSFPRGIPSMSHACILIATSSSYSSLLNHMFKECFSYTASLPDLEEGEFRVDLSAFQTWGLSGAFSFVDYFVCI
ncbi:hypothetical protein DY000_02019369 [Brassica cretica]|uniref:Uncharacterized protein n=1 Tax=Brassica cretica TaxID=69181 RepID=A0ABQ7CZ52_BRACR|nr:hypothetical protein DY000_02019369 [Brassica cretica]